MIGLKKKKQKKKWSWAVERIADKNKIYILVRTPCLYIVRHIHLISYILSQLRIFVNVEYSFKLWKENNFFFQNRQLWITLLDKIVGRRLRKLPETCWNYSFRQVSIISHKITVFRDIFNHIKKKPDDWSALKLTQARGFVAILDFQYELEISESNKLRNLNICDTEIERQKSNSERCLPEFKHIIKKREIFVKTKTKELVISILFYGRKCWTTRS